MRAFLAFLASISLAQLARTQCTPYWTEGLDAPGVDGEVLAQLVFDDGSGAALYVGGSFPTVDGLDVDNVARRANGTWSALGAGLASLLDVRTLAAHDAGTGSELYAAGAWDNPANGQLDGRVYRWDGANWSVLGTPLPGPVSALASFDGGGGPELFAANWDGSAGRVHRWTGTSWQLHGSQSGREIRALKVADIGAGPRLFVGGAFTAIGGVAASGVASWDGSSWAAVGPAHIWLYPNQVHVIEAFDFGAGTQLHVGGANNFGPGTATLAVWTGSAWSTIGGGTSAAGGSAVDALASYDDGGGARLFVGGTFTSAGGTAVHKLAAWDGATWSAVGGGVEIPGNDSASRVASLAVFDDGGGARLHVGGRFDQAGGQAVANLSTLDGGTWRAIDEGEHGLGGSGAVVKALARFDDGSGTKLYAGGTLQRPGGIAVRVGDDWQSLPVALDDGFTDALIAFDDGGGAALFAGGYFTENGTSYGVGRWDGAQWTQVGSLLGGAVHALAVFDDGSGAKLHAAGEFTSGASRIARWDGVQWTQLGSGMTGSNDAVYALHVHDDGAGAQLYAGGHFSAIGSLAVRNLARWSGSSWSAVATAMTSNNPPTTSVYALTTWNGALYAAGNFSSIDGVGANAIARRTGSSWATLGTGASGPAPSIAALAVHDDGGGAQLAAGGSFTALGGVSAIGIGRWSGSAWSALGTGFTLASDPPYATLGDGQAICLLSASDALGTALWAGGSFSNAGSVGASNIARWRCPLAPTSYCTAKTNSLGCVPTITFAGVPSATTGTGFVIGASNILNQKNGLLFYGLTGAHAAAFQGGTLCMHTPLARTPIADSGGSGSGDDCTGTHAYDFNARIASGVDPALVLGQLVQAQWYTRDPAASFTVGLSDALEFTILE